MGADEIVCFKHHPLLNQSVLSTKIILLNMTAFLQTFRCQKLLRSSIRLLLDCEVNTTSVRHYKPRWVAPTLRDLKARKTVENNLNDGPKISHRNTFLEWNYNAELFAFGNRLGEKFEDNFLREALTNKSYIEGEASRMNEVGLQLTLAMKSNEELSVKGQQQISKFVKGYLRAILTKVPEEMIISIHDHLVSTESLAYVAKNIGLGDLLLSAEFPCLDETLSRSFQAVVAALEKSSSEERARTLVQDLVITQLYGKDINELWNPADPARILNTILHKNGMNESEFRLIRKAGSNTLLAVYHVGIYSNKTFVASGTGESVEIAQEMAARNGLKKLFHTDDSMRALPFGRQLKELQQKIKDLENTPNVSLHEWALDKSMALQR